MSFKVCVYNGCENYSVGNQHFGNFLALFRFPKDPERCQKWMENGKVSPTISKNELLMCSDHFENRYLAISPRRTTLVGLAVPIPCEKEDNDEITTSTFEEISAEEPEAVTDFLINESTNDYYKSEMHDYNESDVVEQHFLNLEPEEVIENNYCAYFNQNENIESSEIGASVLVQTEEKFDKISRKRKINDEDIIPMIINKNSYKIKAHTDELVISEEIDVNASKKLNVDKIECTTEKDDVNIGLIDNKRVTTVLLNAREYVQMPKEYYIQEKRELLTKIKKLESKLSAVQQSIEVMQTFIEN